MKKIMTAVAMFLLVACGDDEVAQQKALTFQMCEETFECEERSRLEWVCKQNLFADRICGDEAFSAQTCFVEHRICRNRQLVIDTDVCDVHFALYNFCMDMNGG